MQCMKVLKRETRAACESCACLLASRALALLATLLEHRQSALVSKSILIPHYLSSWRFHSVRQVEIKIAVPRELFAPGLANDLSKNTLELAQQSYRTPHSFLDYFAEVETCFGRYSSVSFQADFKDVPADC